MSVPVSEETGVGRTHRQTPPRRVVHQKGLVAASQALTQTGVRIEPRRTLADAGVVVGEEGRERRAQRRNAAEGSGVSQ
jgi:hypothetical protein